MSKIDKLLLLLLVFAGTVLRFYRFGDAIGWWGDAARDYLVAYHLAMFNETLIVGHFATGLSSGFYHPPYYYYFLSFLIRVFESPFFVTGFFTLLHALSIVTMYAIGKELYGSRTGLVSAALFTVSAKMVNTSRGLISANITLPLIMLSVLFFIKGIKNAHKGYVYLGLTLLLIAGSFWYGIFTVLLYMLVFVFWRFRRQNHFLTALTVYIVAGMLLVELPLILYFGIDRVATVFSPQNNIHIDFSLFGSFVNILRDYLVNVFDQNTFFTGYGLVLLILLTLFLLWKSPRSLLAPILPVSAIVYGVVLSSMKRGDFLAHYLTPYEPILFLIVGYLVANTFRYSRASRWQRICIVASGVVLLFIVSNNFSYIKFFPSDFHEAREITRLIVQEMDNSSFHVAVSASDTPSGWESPTLWYFLERDSHTKLVHTVNYGENLEENSQEYTYRIFVCKNFDSPQEEYGCYEKLHSQHKQHKLVNTSEYHLKNNYVVFITRIPS